MTAKDLKNALLQEAVQGKLVPQIASEGNARDLLEEIRKAREGGECLPLAAARNAPLLISEDEIPFDIPESWCWCRLSEYVDIRDGTHDSPKYVDKGYPFITSKNLQNGKLDFNNVKYISEEDHKKICARSNVETGDILYSMIGGNIGKPVMVIKDREFSIKNVALFKPYSKETYMKYILFYLEAITEELRKIASGGCQPFVGLNVFRNWKFPLPPLAEQKRIVAAIEKFMPLIEEYGKKETVLNQLNAQIGTLTKKAILQEAVQGKLVPQIPAEGNVKDLLEQIKAQKAALIKEGKIKKEKPLPEITEEEIPFDIPENWCWCKVGDLFSTMSGLGYKKDVLEEKTNHMIRVLRGGNILDTSYVFKDDDIMISSEYVKPELFLKKNYLITPAVTSLEHIGKMGYVEKDYDDTVVGGFVLMLIPYLSDETISKYCLYLFGTHWFRTMCKEITHKSGQAFYNLSRDKLLQLEIPLPPLPEQKRIVAAIEQLLPLCEKLGK